MDLTSRIAISNPPHDPDEAFTVLSRQHPGLTRCGDGTFEYRGYRFNHFLSGLSLNGGPNGYLLVDVEDSRLWLFTYGDAEERWTEFVRAKQPQREARAPRRRGLLEWLGSVFA